MLCVCLVDGSERDDIAGAFIGGEGAESRRGAGRISIEQIDQSPAASSSTTGACRVGGARSHGHWAKWSARLATPPLQKITKCDHVVVAVMWLATDV